MTAVLAISGGAPVRSEPFTAWPVHDERERELLLKVLESGVWSFGGPVEAEFSERFAEFSGAKYALCVANGSVSLEIALRALGVGPGDEVIVPALTWTATAWAAVQVGATPVFADISEEDWCIDPASIAEKITEKTRAVIPVHLYNQTAEMDEILALARRHSLWVVEDCAHAHGSRWGDRGVGTLGDIGSFSFQQTKGMTSGEGGILLTDGDELAERIYGLKNCARAMNPGGRHTFGANYRITEFQAAILLAQLERLPGQLEKKAQNIALFREKLSAIPGVTALAPKAESTRQGLYAVSVSVDPKMFGNVPREAVAMALEAEGIPVEPPYDVVYCASLWKGGADVLRFETGVDPTERLGLNSNCPRAERVAHVTGLTIPHEVFLGPEKDIEDLVAGFEKVQSNASELRTMGLKMRARGAARDVLRKIGARE